jgi:hypothetical protein
LLAQRGNVAFQNEVLLRDIPSLSDSFAQLLQSLIERYCLFGECARCCA